MGRHSDPVMDRHLDNLLNSMESMVDVERLIFEIKKIPKLYDEMWKFYGGRAPDTSNCWKEIGCKIFSDWDEMTGGKRRKKCELMKKIWNALNQSYFRCFRNLRVIMQNELPSKSKRSACKYFDQLRFLTPTLPNDEASPKIRPSDKDSIKIFSRVQSTCDNKPMNLLPQQYIEQSSKPCAPLPAKYCKQSSKTNEMLTQRNVKQHIEQSLEPSNLLSSKPSELSTQRNIKQSPKTSSLLPTRNCKQSPEPSDLLSSKPSKMMGSKCSEMLTKGNIKQSSKTSDLLLPRNCKQSSEHSDLFSSKLSGTMDSSAGEMLTQGNIKQSPKTGDIPGNRKRFPETNELLNPKSKILRKRPHQMMCNTDASTDVSSASVALSMTEELSDCYGHRSFLLSYLPAMNILPNDLAMAARAEIIGVFQQAMNRWHYGFTLNGLKY